MPGPMPYLVEKSPYFEVIESLLADPTKRPGLLQQLRQGAMLSDIAGFESTNLGTPPTGAGPGTGDRRDPPARKRHLNEQWFGMTDASGAWVKQPNVFPTGFWTDYQGDPEAIMREGMARAIEVSLGVPHVELGEGLQQPVAPVRQWPIDMYWLCQGPWFQCWVLWRQSDTTATEGHVTVLITTPAAEGYPLTPKITRPVKLGDPPYTDPEYASPPPPGAQFNHRGMWVIGHDEYEMKVTCSTTPDKQGVIVWPQVEWRATDQNVVVCVAPSEWEGGVLHNGRPYVYP